MLLQLCNGRSLVHDFVFPFWRDSVRWRVGFYDCSTATQNANRCPDGALDNAVKVLNKWYLIN